MLLPAPTTPVGWGGDKDPLFVSKELLEAGGDDRCPGAAEGDHRGLLADGPPEKSQGYRDADRPEERRPGVHL